MGDSRRFKLSERSRSFGHAFAGVHYVLASQHNAWIHALATTVVVILAFWLKLSAVEWAILVTAIMCVWVAEFINTAIEAVVNLVTEERMPLAGAAKDVAAGAVLVAAIGAILIGVLILGPKLQERLLG